MKDVAPVSEYQLVQLVSVANTVSRAENRPVTAALEWLAGQVKDHQLPSRLFSLPTSPGEKIVEWAPTGDTSQWDLILRKTERLKDAKDDDQDRMPSIAQSRYLHVDDLAQLAASADTSELCRAALLELVGRQGVKPRSHVGSSKSASLSAAEPVPVVDAVVGEGPNNDRGARVKRKALIERNRRRWPTIERDLQDASSNGLSAEAKADGTGFWWEGDAQRWAEARYKLEAHPAPLGLATVLHRMVG